MAKKFQQTFYMLTLISLFCLSNMSEKPAYAAYFTSLDLLKMCKSPKEVDMKNCHGYVAGIIDYHNLAKSLKTKPAIDFCVPKKLPIRDISLRVMAYLAKHPQHDYFVAAPAIAMALHKEYPCSS